MKLYEEQRKKIYSLLEKLPCTCRDYSPDDCAVLTEKNRIIFRNETAFELGSMGLPSVCSVLFTDATNVCDGVSIYGKDLCELNGDSPFAHITEIGFNTSELVEPDYEALKDIEFSAYRLATENYSVQVAPLSEREQVRVGKNALKSGLSFYNIGCAYIEEYKKNPLVKTAHITFVTAAEFDYISMSMLAKKIRKITGAVTSRFGNQALDCASCSMKAICDEVDGLRELHFKNNNSK